MPNIFNLNYTNQDFWSMKTRLVEFVQQQFTTQFSDFVESSLAIMLIENFAFLADTLSFKIDQIANEIFIDTVTELDNGFRLAELVGFQPQPPIPGASMWTATINNPILTDLSIVTPFAVTAQSGSTNITIELFPADSNNNPVFNQNIIIPAGSIVNSSIVGLEGQTKTQTVSSTGIVGQTIQLSFFPVIFDSVMVTVDGVSWQEVEFFTESQPLREYLVSFDANWVAYVIFGDGVAGLIPSNGSQIIITYRQGGGTAGNITTGAVSTQTIVNVPGLNYGVPVNFTNYTAGVNGYNGDTLDDIRAKLPAWTQTQLRCVTGLDYQNYASQFATPYNGSVGAATAVLRSYGCSANIIDLYILAINGTNGLIQASNELKVALQQALANVQMFTDFVCIRDGFILEVDITIDVIMSSFYRNSQAQYNTLIQNRLNSFFGLSNWSFGESLSNTDIIQILSNITEITSLEISFTTNNANNGGSLVTATFNQIIRPDTIVIAFIYQ